MAACLNFRESLRQELVERCNRNPKYSLRSFARDLRLEPARLSDVLNGKKGISRQVALSLAKVIGLSEAETQVFCDSVDSLHGRSRISREDAKRRLRKHVTGAKSTSDLSADAFKVISDWYHFAILQLLKIQCHQTSISWIAHCLGLQDVQAQAALDRLERLELVEKKGRVYKITSDFVFSPDGVPSDALKKFHEQILQKAISALYIQAVPDRNFFAMTMPMKKADIIEARQKIQKFVVSLCDELSSSSQCDSVYCFSTQLFNLTPALEGGSKYV